LRRCRTERKLLAMQTFLRVLVGTSFLALLASGAPVFLSEQRTCDSSYPPVCTGGGGYPWLAVPLLALAMLGFAVALILQRRGALKAAP
jgi:hypothetical protein